MILMLYQGSESTEQPLNALLASHPSSLSAYGTRDPISALPEAFSACPTCVIAVPASSHVCESWSWTLLMQTLTWENHFLGYWLQSY